MAISLARYVVTIHPDFTVFRREIAAEAARLSRTGFNVRPNLDLTAFRAQFRIFEAVYLRDRTFSVTPHLSPGSITTTINNTFNQIDRRSEAAGRQAGSSFGGGFATRWKLIAAGIVAALPLLQPLIGVLGSIVQAAGAVGAALPLAIGFLGVSVAALVLSFHNLGKAIKGAFSGTPTKAEREAYEKLSVSAKGFVGILLDTRTKLKGFQTEVQEQFFKPFLHGFRGLVASPAIAQLRVELGLIASDAGSAGSAIAVAFAGSAQSGQLATILAGIRGTFGQLVSLAGPLTKMFLVLAQAAQPFVDILVGRLVNGLRDLTGLVDRSAADGRLAKFFNDGAAAIGHLITVVGNIGSIIGSLFSGITGGSNNALAGLAGLTEQFSTFLESAQGQQILGLFADKLALIGDIIKSVIGPVLPLIIQLAQIIGSALSSGIRTFLPMLEQLLLLLVGGLQPIIAALAPVFNRLVEVVAKFVEKALIELNVHVAKMLPQLLELAEKMGPMLLPVVEAFGEALLALVPLIPALSDFIVQLIPIMIDLLPVFQAQADASVIMIGVLKWLIEIIVVLIGWVARLGPPFLAWAALIDIIADNLIFAWDHVVSWFRTKIAPSFMEALRNIAGFFTGLWDWIVSIGNKIKQWWDDFIGHSWFQDVVVAGFRRAIDNIIGIFTGLRDRIEAVVTFIRDRIFGPLINFVTQTLPSEFRRGVDLIGFWWNALRELARTPVAFVVNQVINPLIRGYNAVAGNFGGKTVAEIRGFAEGGHFDGRLPGPPSDVDNMLARGPGGRPLALASGEYVVNARQTARHLPLLRSINSGIEGFAPGGLIGGFFDFITNPLAAARSAFGGPLARLASIAGTPFGQMIASMPRRLFDLLAEQVKKLFSFTAGPGGGPGPGFPPWGQTPKNGGFAGDSGVWRSILALVRASGIPYSFGNAFRRGDPLWHGAGRAIDFMGYNQDRLASFFMSMRPRVLELIHRTRAGDYGITRGRISPFRTQWPLHENHLHIAMKQGGLLARVFDQGGIMRPGDVGVNLSNRNERVIPDGAPISLSPETIRAIGREFVAALTGGGMALVQMGRSR